MNGGAWQSDDWKNLLSICSFLHMELNIKTNTDVLRWAKWGPLRWQKHVLIRNSCTIDGVVITSQSLPTPFLNENKLLRKNDVFYFLWTTHLFCSIVTNLNAFVSSGCCGCYGNAWEASKQSDLNSDVVQTNVDVYKAGKLKIQQIQGTLEFMK